MLSAGMVAKLARWALPGLLIVLAVVPFLPAVDGEWVHDDRVQIVENHLVQQPSNWREALHGDVWAFKRSGTASPSNYWRPGFVGWLIANTRAFGPDDTRPWHAAVLALHALACLLAWCLLRTLGMSGALAFGVSALFAVHPVHVESVAWISGATDPLLAVFALGALLALARGVAAGRRGRPWWGAALLLYALALGCKETAVLLPALVPVMLALVRPDVSWRRRWLAALPFALLAIAFLAVRWWVIGGFQIELQGRVGWFGIAVNVPRLLMFYVARCLWPWPLSPAYPLRAHPSDSLDGWSFLSEVGAVAILVVVAIALWRRYRIARFGLLLFALPLLPAFNLDAFLADQIVHDRYLYLPLLGLLIALSAPVADAVRRWPRWQVPATGALAAAAVAMIVASGAYASIWAREIDLWRRAVAVDPGSASSWAMLGREQYRLGDHAAALRSAERSIAIAPVTSAVLLRADIALASRQWSAAQDDLRQILREHPHHPPAIERLALALQQQGRWPEAAALLEDFRRAAPAMACRSEVDLAIVHYRMGSKDRARRWLDAAVERSAEDRSGPCLAAHFHLAALLAETGDRAAALRHLELYRELTRGLADRTTRELREPARELADRLSRATLQAQPAASQVTPRAGP